MVTTNQRRAPDRGRVKSAEPELFRPGSRSVRLIWRLCLGLRGLAEVTQPRKLRADLYVMF